MINILVIEKEKRLCNIICSFLNGYGYKTEQCREPDKAYSMIENNNYSLIIADILMPSIDGIDIAKTICSINRTLPILFISTLDDSSYKTSTIGIIDYLVKPINFNELEFKAKTLIKRAKKHKRTEYKRTGI